MTDAFAEWIKSSPESVRKLAAEFPIGSTFEVHGRRHYLMGYTEDDHILVTPIDPSADYDRAYAERVAIFATHGRSQAQWEGPCDPIGDFKRLLDELDTEERAIMKRGGLKPAPLTDMREMQERLHPYIDPI